MNVLKKLEKDGKLSLDIAKVNELGKLIAEGKMVKLKRVPKNILMYVHTHKAVGSQPCLDLDYNGWAPIVAVKNLFGITKAITYESFSPEGKRRAVVKIGKDLFLDKKPMRKLIIDAYKRQKGER